MGMLTYRLLHRPFQGGSSVGVLHVSVLVMASPLVRADILLKL